MRSLAWWALLATLVLLGVACSPPATAAPAPSSVSSAAETVANRAVWAPGELDEHFRKHPQEYRSAQEYDRGARDTIRRGVRFTYRDSTTGAPRVGYYDPGSNRFTGMTADERRITTHFQPDRGVAYIRGLRESSYR